MTDEQIDEFLGQAFCGRTATIGPDGYPYVVPNLFVWRERRVYLHTALYEGHFLANVRHCGRVSFEADEPGRIFPYGHVECDTSVSYRSVVLFGRIEILEDEGQKMRFYESFMAKYAPPESWGREKGSFPRIGSTVVYAITPEVITGKQGSLPAVSDQWPATNRFSGSPNWKPKPTPPG